jgi:chorismate mutase
MAEERAVNPAGAPPPAAAESAEIEAWRRRIDQIDTQLMGLLNSRSACAVEIGRIKRTLGLPVYSPEREARILERVMRENPGPLDPTAVRRVFERIIDESRRLERLAAHGEETAVEKE